MAHDEQAGVSQVVREQEFPPRLSCPPDGQLGLAAHPGLVGPADQGGDYVPRVGTEIIVRSEHVGRDGGDKVGPVFPPIRLAQLPTGQFGSGVGSTGWFQHALHERLDPQRLLRVSGIAARTAEVEQLAGTMAVGGRNDVGEDQEVVQHQFGWPGAIDGDAAGGAGRDKDILGTNAGKERLDLSGCGQIRFLGGRSDQVVIASRAETSPEGVASQGLATGDIDASRAVHASSPAVPTRAGERAARWGEA